MTETENETTVHVPIVPRGPQKKILANLRKYRWAVIVAHRRMGKTVIAVVYLILSALMNTKRRPVYAYIAPLLKQAKAVAWDYLLFFTKYLPNRKVSIAELSVTLHNGAVIRLFGGDHPDSLRGLYLDGAVLDEPAQMKPDLFPEVLRPALSDRKGWALWIGTPKGVNAFHEKYEEALRNPDYYCGVFPVSETKLLSDDELLQMRNTLSENQYRQEMECDFAASAENTLISFEVVSKSKGRQVSTEHYYRQPRIVGVDVARFGDDKTVIQKRQGVMAWEPEIMAGLDQMEVAARVANVMDEWKPDAVFIDQGLGHGVIDRLKQLNYKVTEVPFGSRASKPERFKNKRAEMWWLMKEWLSVGRIPDNKVLISDLLGPTYKEDVQDKIVLEKKQDMKERGLSSPDLGDALALTFAHPVRPSTVVGMRSERPSGLGRSDSRGGTRYARAYHPLRNSLRGVSRGA